MKGNNDSMSSTIAENYNAPDGHSISRKESGSFRLPDLLFELRAKIYSFVDADDLLSFRATCQIIRSETEHLVYDKLVFYFDWMNHFELPYRAGMVSMIPEKRRRPQSYHPAKLQPMDLDLVKKVRNIMIVDAIEDLTYLFRIFPALQKVYCVDTDKDEAEYHRLQVDGAPNDFTQVREGKLGEITSEIRRRTRNMPQVSGGVRKVIDYHLQASYMWQWKFDKPFDIIVDDIPLIGSPANQHSPYVQGLIKREALRQEVLDMLSTKEGHFKLWNDLATFFETSSHWLRAYYDRLCWRGRIKWYETQYTWFIPSPTDVIRMVQDDNAYTDSVKGVVYDPDSNDLSEWVRSEDLVYVRQPNGQWRIQDLSGRPNLDVSEENEMGA